MVAVVPQNAAVEILERLAGMNEQAFLIGEIIERKDGADRLVWA
jgi:hydrogenase maturation factor